MNRDDQVSQVRETLIDGSGRRCSLRAAAAVGALGAAGAGGAAIATAPAAAAAPAAELPKEALQPGTGPIYGQHYLPSSPDQVRWGYVPSLSSEPVLRMRSGETVTIDTVSHEGILEDQGRDPLRYFAGHGVPASKVLTDAVAIARDYQRTT